MANTKLEFHLNLIDGITGPMKGVMKTIDDLGMRGKDAMTKIGIGVAGIVGAGMAVKSALEPAIDMNRALGEVRSLDVANDALEELRQTALNFSSDYGLSATDFVRSSYDIQSAIAGLNGKELSAFTEASNLLAKGTKANAGTITSYMGTMYGIFKDEAEKLGNANWVNEIAGKTALAVKIFKTSGDGMSSAFTALGAQAKSAGISVAEQFAVLGNLQATMSGSEAGTKYKAFLAGVGNAQKSLGLSFTDTNGNMLDMVTILNKIKGKFGDTLDVAEAGALKKAFGSDEAVALIKLLLPKVGALKDNIQDIANVKDIKGLENMARSMVDPWGRLGQIIDNVKTAIGSAVLKKLEPIMDKIADMGSALVNWLNTYENIARWIGYISIAIIGFGAFSVMFTLFSGAIGALGVAFSALSAPILAVGRLIAFLINPFKLLPTLIGGFLKIAITGFSLFGSALKFLINPLNLLRMGLGLLFNPIGALIAVGYLIYKYRDDFKMLFAGIQQGFGSLSEHLAPLKAVFATVKNAVMRIFNAITRVINAFTGAGNSAQTFNDVGVLIGQVLGAVLDGVVWSVELVGIAIDGIAGIFENVASGIIQDWEQVKSAWDADNILESFLNIGKMIGNVFKNSFQGVVNMFVNMLNFLIEKANNLPGINIPLMPKWENDPIAPMQEAVGGVQDTANFSHILPKPATTTSTPLRLAENTKPQFQPMPQGLLSKNLTSNKTVNNNYGGFTFHTGANVDEIMQKIHSREQLAAG